MVASRSVLIAFVMAAALIAFTSTLGSREQVIAERELALAFSLRVTGSLVAIIGLVGMMGQWYSGAPVSRFAPAGFVILAGVTVASQAWSAALALGVSVAAAVLARQAPPNS